MNNYSYHRLSDSLHEELVARLFHNGSIHEHENTSVYTKIEKVARGTSVE